MVGQCVVALEGVGVEIEGSSVAAAEELAGVDAAESVVAAELEEVVADAVVVEFHHS